MSFYSGSRRVRRVLITFSVVERVCDNNVS